MPPQSPAWSTGIFYHVTARLHMSSSGGQWKLCTLQQADAILIMGGGAEEAGDGKLLAVVRCTLTLYLLTCYCTCILLCKTLLFARNKVDCDVGKSYFMNAECFSSVPPQSLPFLHPMPLTSGPKGGGGKNAWQHIFWGDENRGSLLRTLRHLFSSEHQSVSLMNRVKNKFHIRLFGSPIH